MKFFVYFLLISLLLNGVFLQSQKQELEVSLEEGETHSIDMREFDLTDKIYVLGDKDCNPINPTDIKQFIKQKFIPSSLQYEKPKLQNVNGIDFTYWNNVTYIKQVFDSNTFLAWLPTMAAVVRNGEFEKNQYKFLVFDFPLENLKEPAKLQKEILIDIEKSEEPHLFYDSRILTMSGNKHLIMSGRYNIPDSTKYFDGFSFINLEGNTKQIVKVHKFEPLYNIDKYDIKTKHLEVVELISGDTFFAQSVYVSDNNQILYPSMERESISFIEIYRFIKPHLQAGEKVFRLLPIDKVSLQIPNLQILDSRTSPTGELILYDNSTKSLIKVIPQFGSFSPIYKKEVLNLSKYQGFLKLDIYGNMNHIQVAVAFENMVIEIEWDNKEQPEIVKEYPFNYVVSRVIRFGMSDQFIVFHFKRVQRKESILLAFNRYAENNKNSISYIQKELLTETALSFFDKAFNMLIISNSKTGDQYIVELRQPKLYLTAINSYELTDFTVVNVEDKTKCPIALTYESFTEEEDKVFDCLPEKTFEMTIDQFSNLKIDLKKFCKGNNLLYTLTYDTQLQKYPLTSTFQTIQNYYRDMNFSLKVEHADKEIKMSDIDRQKIYEWEKGLINWVILEKETHQLYHFLITEANQDITIKSLAYKTQKLYVKQHSYFNKKISIVQQYNQPYLDIFIQGKHFTTKSFCQPDENIYDFDVDPTHLYVVIYKKDESDGWILYSRVTDKDFEDQIKINAISFKRIDKTSFPNTRSWEFFFPGKIVPYINSGEYFLKCHSGKLYYVNLDTQQVLHIFQPTTLRPDEIYYFVVQKNFVCLIYETEIYVYEIQNAEEIYQKAYFKLQNQRMHYFHNIAYSNDLIYILQDALPSGVHKPQKEIQILDISQEEKNMKIGIIGVDATRIQLIENLYQKPHEQVYDKLIVENSDTNKFFIYHIHKNPKLIIQNIQIYNEKRQQEYLTNVSMTLGVTSFDHKQFQKSYKLFIKLPLQQEYKLTRTKAFNQSTITPKAYQLYMNKILNSSLIRNEQQQQSSEKVYKIKTNQFISDESMITKVSCTDSWNQCCQKLQIQPPFRRDRVISNINLEQNYTFQSIIKNNNNKWIYAATANKIFRFTFDSFTNTSNSIYDLVQLPFHQTFKTCQLVAVDNNDMFTVSQCFDGAKWSAMIVSYIAIEPHVMGEFQLDIDSYSKMVLLNNILFVFNSNYEMVVYKLLLNQRTGRSAAWYEKISDKQFENSDAYSDVHVDSSEEDNVYRMFFKLKNFQSIYDMFEFNVITDEFKQKDRINFIRSLAHAKIPEDYMKYYEISDLEISGINFFHRESLSINRKAISRYHIILSFKYYDTFYFTVDFSTTSQFFLDLEVKKKLNRYGDYINSQKIYVNYHGNEPLYVLIAAKFPTLNDKSEFSQQQLLAYNMTSSKYAINFEQSYRINSINTDYPLEVLHSRIFMHSTNPNKVDDILFILHINPETLNLENIVLTNNILIKYNSNDFTKTKCKNFQLTLHNEEYSKIIISDIPIYASVKSQYKDDEGESRLWVIFVVLGIVGALIFILYLLFLAKDKIFRSNRSDDINANPVVLSEDN